DFDRQLADRTAIPGRPPAVEADEPREAVASEERDALELSAARQRGDRFVRVPLERLDELIRLVSELVIARTALEQQVNAQAQEVVELQWSTERLQRTVSELEVRYEVRTLARSAGRNKHQPSRNNRSDWSSIPDACSLQRSGGVEEEFDELELDRYTEF